MCLEVRGGKPLKGEIAVHGAKNSVLPILSATVLHAGICVIENCPRLRDVHSAVSILEHLGCCVQHSGNTVTVDATSLKTNSIPDAMMRAMRSSVIFLGAVLARTGRAELYLPGGCELGNRPIDFHLSALRCLGADVSEEGGHICCSASHMVGREIQLSFPSVGATENIMLAATAAKGTTRIRNAAREPEIVDLACFLQTMGIGVRGAGTSEIEIDCATKTQDVRYRIMPDRIVAATYLIGAAMTNGDVVVSDVVPEHVATITALLECAGCSVSIERNRIRVRGTNDLKSCGTIRTMPYPGFPTDAQAPLMALATQCHGTAVFVENIFDSRFRHVSELVRMGANIQVVGKVAVVEGKSTLSGAHVEACDLRGGAALVLATLCADGVSRISGETYIDRGYEAIEIGLSELGAEITRKGE